MVDLNINIKVPAIEQLLKYTASGVGVVAGPILAPYKAFFEGKAELISAQAEAKVLLTQAESEGEALKIIAKAQSEAKKQYLVTQNEESTRDSGDQSPRHYTTNRIPGTQTSGKYQERYWRRQPMCLPTRKSLIMSLILIGPPVSLIVLRISHQRICGRYGQRFWLGKWNVLERLLFGRWILSRT